MGIVKLVNSLNGLLNCEKRWIRLLLLQQSIYLVSILYTCNSYTVFCNSLVRVICSRVSGQCFHAIQMTNVLHVYPKSASKKHLYMGKHSVVRTHLPTTSI